EIEALGARMYELATQMPGFVSYKDYIAEDSEAVAIVEFESYETLGAWRRHPEHVAAQEAGRARFFEDYRVSVCEVSRDYVWAASS
ncbi:MAG TPA: antibiotic biosynthesis monooxygenase, partial [Burkholderiales bacterium]|nr:antibiotic biosynthesis monooxygenase [Burkholderiales bacterium]